MKYSNFDIPGKDCKDKHRLNIELILVILFFIINLDISKEIKEEKFENI